MRLTPTRRTHLIARPFATPLFSRFVVTSIWFHAGFSYSSPIASFRTARPRARNRKYVWSIWASMCADMGCCERVRWATSSLMIAVSGGDVPLRRGGGVTVAELRLPTGYHRIAASEFRCRPHNDLSTPTHQIPVRCDLIRACPPNGVAQPSPVHQTTRSLTYENQYARLTTSLSGPHLVRETIRIGPTGTRRCDVETYGVYGHQARRASITGSLERSHNPKVEFSSRSLRSHCFLPGGKTPVSPDGDSTGGGTRVQVQIPPSLRRKPLGYLRSCGRIASS
jgi:hypothetical protein